MGRQLIGQPENSNPLFITLSNNSEDVTFYTVPSNRKFIGRIFNAFPNSNGPDINNLFFGNMSQRGSDSSSTSPTANASTIQTFGPGTTVRNASSTVGRGCVIGMEVDL